jgi:gamma-glutamyl hercynylcysteine S-oxide synthase
VRHDRYPRGITREDVLEWYQRLRRRSHDLFALVEDEAFYDRPIALRNPIVFYEGHLSAFALNTLVKRGHGRPGVDDALETLFARGIDPEDVRDVDDPSSGWPSRPQVRSFTDACDALVEDALRNAPLVRDDVPSMRGGEAVLTILEHEAMHHETLSYMLHELAHEKKRRPAGYVTSRADELRASRADSMVAIPPGRATLGRERGAYGWDNEFPSHVVDVDAFAIAMHNVTNAEYLEFVAATGASPSHFWKLQDGAWCWRAMFELVPLPLESPVYVTHEQATAYASWKGMRLPSESEFHRAAYTTPNGQERLQPWGDALPEPHHGNFDFQSFDPRPIGSNPSGASAWGVHDLVGNGWEWTSSVFAGFEGFVPMPSYPEYSADFFDAAHFVLKGASPATPRELIRRSFRNWFRPNYPYVHATFRCVR